MNPLDEEYNHEKAVRPMVVGRSSLEFLALASLLCNSPGNAMAFQRCLPEGVVVDPINAFAFPNTQPTSVVDGFSGITVDSIPEGLFSPETRRWQLPTKLKKDTSGKNAAQSAKKKLRAKKASQKRNRK